MCKEIETVKHIMFECIVSRLLWDDERGFGAHEHQCSHHFQKFEDFKILYFYVFKNYGVKYIDRYTQEKCM
jgi:hypothetical protein